MLREFCSRENSSELAEEAVPVGEKLKKIINSFNSDFYRESKER